MNKINDELLEPLAGDFAPISHNEAISAVRHLSGKIYTLLDAVITDEKQLHAVKDIARAEFSSTYDWLMKAANPNYLGTPVSIPSN